MIEVVFGFLAVLPQATERIDFSLHSGVILTAILFFVLINVLLGAVLYPYFKEGSLFEDDERAAEEASAEASKKGMVEEAPSGEGEPLEKQVDEFLEDIHGERSR